MKINPSFLLFFHFSIYKIFICVYNNSTFDLLLQKETDESMKPNLPIKYDQITDAIRCAEQRVLDTVLAVHGEIVETVNTVKERDPAARSAAEVLLLYSGVHAILAHRVSHKLYEKGHYFSARALSQAARFVTGIEIHPAAKIGKRFFIDHGMGVVIGETTEIGDDCTIYQGVTLGGTGKDVGKRHPTLGNNVMVGAGAKVLGPVEIGSNSKIAANAVVLHPVTDNSTAVGIPAKVVRRDGKKIPNDLDQIHIPDPVAQEIQRLNLAFEELQARVDSLAVTAPRAKRRHRAAGLRRN